jgi:hypothetical protein
VLVYHCTDVADKFEQPPHYCNLCTHCGLHFWSGTWLQPVKTSMLIHDLHEGESINKVNLHFFTDICVRFVLMNSVRFYCMSERVVLVISL